MADVVTLDQVRAHLRFPATYTQDDLMLSTVFIPAASAVVRRECGEILQEQYDEFYDGGNYSIWLRHKPVLSVQMVQEGWGFTNYILDYVQVNAETTANMFAYSLDIPGQGVISRRSGGNVNIPFIPGTSNIHVIYTTGLEEIPANVVLGALQIIAFWYRGFEQRQSGKPSGFSTLNADFPHSGNDIYTPQNQGVPSWLIELLKPNRRPPIIG